MGERSRVQVDPIDISGLVARRWETQPCMGAALHEALLSRSDEYRFMAFNGRDSLHDCAVDLAVMALDLERLKVELDVRMRVSGGQDLFDGMFASRLLGAEVSVVSLGQMIEDLRGAVMKTMKRTKVDEVYRESRYERVTRRLR